MSKKDEIITLYFEKKMSAIEISRKVNVVQSYITKIIKSDSRYDIEKQRRKSQTKKRHNKINRENMRKVREKNAIDNECLKLLLYHDSYELSTKKSISNQAFRNWNSSIYKFHNENSEYRVKDDMLNKICYSVPKKIKWK